MTTTPTSKPASQPGTRENPFTHAPEGWIESGVEYGAMCRCAKCNLVAPSTVIFDFYAEKPGDPLVCESCKRGLGYEGAKQHKSWLGSVEAAAAESGKPC